MESITKAAAAVALLLYVVGLVAVNEYLAPYGASDFALLRARFVYTGALVVVPFLITMVAALLIRLGVANWGGGNHKPIRWSLILGASAGLVGGIWWLFDWAVSDWGKGPLHAAEFHAFTLLAASIALVLLVQTALWLSAWYRKVTVSSATWLGRLLGTALRPFILFVTLIVGVFTVLAAAYYLGKVVDDLYPVVPEQFGGGRPLIVAISLTSEGAAALHQLEPRVDQTSYQFVQLLFEGDDYYLFRLPTRIVTQGRHPVFRIQKTLVTVIAKG